MMAKLIMRCLLLNLFLLLIACSAPTANASFQEGREYQLIPNALGTDQPVSRVKVIEFFSYGCPWCYRAEPEVEKWLAHKAHDVDFERIPVVYEQGWDILAKVYYAIKSLGVSEKLMLAVFSGLQEKEIDLTNFETAEQFFATQGVTKQDFDSAYNFSPGIDAQMLRGEKLIKQYGIIAVPAFVVDGKYLTNMGMAGGDPKRLLKIVNFLIAKEKPGDH